MNRLTSTFARLAQQQRKALVGFLTAGDPDFDTSLDVLQAAVGAGLDVLELGVPFSDPTADGPVIQDASQRALKQGMTLHRVLELAGRVRATSDIPLVLFSYYNPLLQYGLARLGRDLSAAGVDGLLIVDLPPEEGAELRPMLASHDLPLIRLLAPTTRPERIRTLVQDAGGFLYLITRTGVTGSGVLDREQIRRQAAEVRRHTALPLCLGFGISSAADARQLSGFADGLVVGSALVKIVAEHATDGQAPERVRSKIAELRQALDERS